MYHYIDYSEDTIERMVHHAAQPGQVEGPRWEIRTDPTNH